MSEFNIPQPLGIYWIFVRDVQHSQEGQLSPPQGWWMSNTVPSGNFLHNYGKSPCLMGKSTRNVHCQ